MVLRLAHELRNPLATIQSAVQLLEHLQQPDEETVEFYEGIYVEVSRIDSVVRDMQRFARLDVHTASAVTVDRAVRTAVESATSGLRFRSNEIVVRKGPEVTVLVDRDQFEGAIAELLNNALNFSPSGTEIELTWKLVEEDQVAIQVNDRGPGVPEDLQDRIMRPFFSSLTHGTGLGLNIVARTCSLAGGRLEWGNRKDGGACFTMTLPVLPERS